MGALVTLVIGDVKGLIEVFTGCDLITGERLGAWRWSGLLFLSELRHARHVDDVVGALRLGDAAIPSVQRRVLVVGEADTFEYAVNLARRHPQLLVTGSRLGQAHEGQAARVLTKRGSHRMLANLTIFDHVDARRLGDVFVADAFDDIVFNAPRAGTAAAGSRQSR